MSDNEIKGILARQKRKERKLQRRAEIIETIEGFAGWGSVILLAFMLSVIGG